jgi:hypothetical protein
VQGKASSFLGRAGSCSRSGFCRSISIIFCPVLGPFLRMSSCAEN